jgi:4-hydroxy-3-methylbut-2-enyl diphosphate reductase
MIHNPQVNEDLQSMGVQFIMDTAGNRLINWSDLKSEDIVITPAFGTTIEIANELESLGVNIKQYNTTCPFVEKVWKRSNEIGGDGYTIVIHGKYKHEETRATFSHAQKNAKSIIIRDMKEARWIADFIQEKISEEQFHQLFDGKCSEGFNPVLDLKRIGVVNQTTMLATETEEISAFLKGVVEQAYGENSFADTRDTLCYATNENQMAAMELLEVPADIALVIGGHKSSNTYQLATILSKKMTTYFIENANDISKEEITFLDVETMTVKTQPISLSSSNTQFCIASGASCPDTLVDEVVKKVCDILSVQFEPDTWIEQWIVDSGITQ